MKVGDKILITTKEWFIAPDGHQYRAVFGTVKGVRSDEETLGIKTNRGSTNWYVEIGNMIVAGCQIHYAIKTDTVNRIPVSREIEYEGTIRTPMNLTSYIYDADEMEERK